MPVASSPAPSAVAPNVSSAGTAATTEVLVTKVYEVAPIPLGNPTVAVRVVSSSGTSELAWRTRRVRGRQTHWRAGLDLGGPLPAREPPSCYGMLQMLHRKACHEGSRNGSSEMTRALFCARCRPAMSSL